MFKVVAFDYRNGSRIVNIIYNNFVLCRSAKAYRSMDYFMFNYLDFNEIYNCPNLLECWFQLSKDGDLPIVYRDIFNLVL